MDNQEIWCDVKGYEGLYAVSNMGRVKSLGNDKSRREKILSPCKSGNGYLQVNLWKEGKVKRYSIHRLVLSTFSPCENSHELQVNHIDEDKTNNMLENLEWVTCKENCNHGTRNARRAEKKSIPVVQLSLEGKYIRSWKSSMDAEREGGFNNAHINSCCKGKLKTHKGYRFIYLKDWLKEHNKGIPKKLYFID